jgi:hypothetical protein
MDKDIDSGSTSCIHCGEPLPNSTCEQAGCSEGEQTVLAAVNEPGACQKCGSLTAPCEQEGCSVVLAHEGAEGMCVYCKKAVEPGSQCAEAECPRVAVETMRQASLDTPFMIGL